MPKQIKIQCSRAPSYNMPTVRAATVSPVRPLDLKQRPKQRERLKPGLDAHRRIQKRGAGRLARAHHRFGLDDAR